MATPKISEYQKDLMIISGLVGMVVAIIVLSYWYSYTAPPPEEKIDTKPRKTFLIDGHLDDFALHNLHDFKFDNDSIQALIPKLTPVSHYWYGRVFQFDELPGGKYKIGESAPFTRPAQAYYFSHQPAMEMWTGYQYDWVTLLFNPQPDSWKVISCFYNRTKPVNPDTPGDEKGILGNFTFFPLAEYGKTEEKEWTRYSHWEDSTLIQSTRIDHYVEDGIPVTDSSSISYEMRVYVRPKVSSYSSYYNGELVETTLPDTFQY